MNVELLSVCNFTHLKNAIRLLITILFFTLLFGNIYGNTDVSNMAKGDSFFKNHQRDSALFYYNRVHQSLLKNKKDETYAILCKRMSSLYRQLGKPEKAIYLSREAIDNYTSNDSIKLAHIYLTLVNAFRRQNELDSMAKALEKVFRLNWRGEDSLITIIALSNQAYIDYKKGNHTQRKSRIMEAFQIAKSNTKYAGHLAWITLYLGESEVQEKNHKAALEYFKEALSYNQVTNFEMSSLLHQRIGVQYAALGKMDSAYLHQNKSTQFKEKYLEKNKQKAILELEKQFETRLNENKILKLNNQKIASEARNKYLKMLLLLLAFIASTLILTFIVFRNRTKIRKNRDRQEIVMLKNKNKLNALEGLMQGQENERKRIAEELHDSIGASLSYIQMGLNQKSNASLNKVRKMVEDCIQDTRNISRNLTPYVLKKWGLEEAIHILCQRAQDANDYQIHKNLDSLASIQLDYTQELHIYRILEECFTNSIRHSQCENIFINTILQNQELSISYEDDGIGFNMKDLEGKNGIGIQNLKNRTEALNATFHMESAKNQGCMLIVSLRLP